MRHMARQKKKKPLKLFTKQMLHSKSTYFYKQRWDSYLVPAMCALALLLVMGLCISPLTPNSESAYADTATPDNASLKLTVGNTSLAKPDAKAGEVNYITTSVNVNAANVDGYKVYVQAAPGNSAVLRNGNTEITGVGSEVATANFENNKWGYALDSTGASVESLTYTSVPENSAILNPAYTTNAASEEKNFNLAFAAKFGTDATAGHYSTNVLLSAVASAKEVAIFDEPTGFNGIMNMQDMTSAVCSGAAEGTSGRLRDTRDMKVYWVTKINNSCWMTQNLDLDLDENINLTSADTDINNAVTLATTQTGSPSFSNSAGAVQSFDPGYYVYSAISPTGACNSTSLSNCNGFTSILNGIWESSDDSNFTGAVDDSTKTYNAHYLVGNYYSYAAATAGSAPGTTGMANNSICPKGWRLPTGGQNVGNFYNTFVGIASSNVVANPYYLTYGGYIDSGSIDALGGDIYYWSSMARNDLQSYSLNYSASSNVFSSNARSNGMLVRCVARDTRKITDLTYMQDMNMSVCLNSAEGDTKN